MMNGQVIHWHMMLWRTTAHEWTDFCSEKVVGFKLKLWGEKNFLTSKSRLEQTVMSDTTKPRTEADVTAARARPALRALRGGNARNTANHAADFQYAAAPPLAHRTWMQPRFTRAAHD